MLHTHSHHFIKNKEVDALYFALSLLTFAEGLISIFVPIYLWSLGFSLPLIVLYFLLDALYFVLLSLILSRYFNRFTDKSLIMAGIPFLLLYYGLLPLVKTFGIFVFLLPVLLTLFRLLFNVGYHTDFTCASDGDDGDLSDEVGAQYMFGALMSFASPLLGGLLILVSGYHLTFWLGTVIVAISLIPLMFFKGHQIAVSKIENSSIYHLIFSKQYRQLVISSCGYAIEATAGSVFWPLYLYLTFASTKTVGGIYSAIALLVAIASFLTGRFGNKARYGKIVTYTVPFVALIWLLRSFFPNEIMVLSTTFAKALVYAIMIVAWSGIYYVLAKRAKPCGELVLASENVFNLARVVGLGLILILSLVMSQNGFFVSLFIISAIMSLLMGRIAKQDMV